MKYLYSLKFDEVNPKTGEILAGCVSSLQRTGGIVTLILNDRIKVGLGATLKDERKFYDLTSI